MEIKIENRTLNAARLYTLKEIEKKFSKPYSSLYLMKLRGDLDIVVVGGIEFAVEPEEGFKKLLSKRKSNK